MRLLFSHPFLSNSLLLVSWLLTFCRDLPPQFARLQDRYTPNSSGSVPKPPPGMSRPSWKYGRVPPSRHASLQVRCLLGKMGLAERPELYQPIQRRWIEPPMPIQSKSSRHYNCTILWLTYLHHCRQRHNFHQTWNLRNHVSIKPWVVSSNIVAIISQPFHGLTYAPYGACHPCNRPLT